MLGRLGTCSHRRHAAVLLSAVPLALAAFLLLVGAYAPAAAQAASKSILIVAPHPDDDVVMASGVVANALAAGDTVTVVYMTNGDDSGTAEGFVRQAQAVASQAQLGTPEEDLIFLGYPTDYLISLFWNYPAATDTLTTPNNNISQTYSGPYGLGGTDYHTYHFGSPADYNGANVLQDLESIIATYRPDDIYTTSQFDKHQDHEATYDFVRMALLNSMAADSSYQPTLHQTIIWADDPANPPTWPLPLDPTTAMTETPGLSDTTLQWSDVESLPVPADMQSTDPGVNPKIKAIDEDQNQGGTTGFLGRFVHSDEIFWPETLSLPDGDIAPLATATASTQSIYTHQTADRAIDGVVDGYPGDSTKEWVTSGEGAGAWLRLTWPEAVTVGRIVLHDRPSDTNQITSAVLEFSDGSSVDVGTPLPNDGSALTVDFAPRSVTSVKLAITSVSETTVNVGLAEMEVYESGASTAGFNIDADTDYTNTTAATLDCGVSDFSAAYMRFRNGTDAWSDWEPYAATKSWTLAGGDGLKTVEGQFQDSSNDILDVTDTITLDTTAPTTTATPSATGWTDGPVTVTLGADDGSGSGVEATYWQIDSGAKQTYSAANKPQLTSSTQSLTYWSTDGAGNSETTHTLQAQIDETSPVTTATPSATGWTNAPVTVTLAASDDGGSGVEATYWQIDSGAVQTYSAANKPQLTSSTQTLTYWSTDGAGNSETTHTLQAQIDETSPVTTATPSATGWTNAPVTVTLAASDDGGSGVEATYWQIDSGAVQTYSAANKPQLTSSTQTLTYWSTDRAGNSETKQTLQSLTDAAAPIVTCDATPTWQRHAVTVHFSPTDAGGSGIAKTEYRLQGAGTWLAAVNNACIVRGSGDWHYEYRALDQAGNVSTIGTFTVRIDMARPLPQAPYRARVRHGRRATIRFRINDAWPKTGTATVELRFRTSKGKTIKKVVLPGRKTNMLLQYRFFCMFKKGTYRFSVYGTDAAGNSQRKAASNLLIVR